jgi:hypothetical protein
MVRMLTRAFLAGRAVPDVGMKRLLMSWYYAGYYTGLYEGQHKRQESEKKDQSQ